VAPTDNVEILYWLLGKGLNPAKKNLFGQYPKDVARSKVVRDLLPVNTDLPQFDIYSGDIDPLSNIEDKIMLKVPSSMKASSSQRTKGSKRSKKLSKKSGGTYGESGSQYESYYEESEEYEEGDDEDEEEEDEEGEIIEEEEEYEEEEDEDEEYSNMGGVSEANSRALSIPPKSEKYSYQGIPSRNQSNRSYGGVSQKRSLTPLRQTGQRNLDNDTRTNLSYIENRSMGKERSATPVGDRLPMIRNNSANYNRKQDNSFIEESTMGRGKTQGQSSYLNYLAEISKGEEKEDLSRDYKLPMIPKKNEYVPR